MTSQPGIDCLLLADLRRLGDFLMRIDKVHVAQGSSPNALRGPLFRARFGWFDMLYSGFGPLWRFERLSLGREGWSRFQA